MNWLINRCSNYIFKCCQYRSFTSEPGELGQRKLTTQAVFCFMILISINYQVFSAVSVCAGVIDIFTCKDIIFIFVRISFLSLSNISKLIICIS